MITEDMASETRHHWHAPVEVQLHIPCLDIDAVGYFHQFHTLDDTHDEQPIKRTLGAVEKLGTLRVFDLELEDSCWYERRTESSGASILPWFYLTTIHISVRNWLRKMQGCGVSGHSPPEGRGCALHVFGTGGTSGLRAHPHISELDYQRAERHYPHLESLASCDRFKCKTQNTFSGALNTKCRHRFLSGMHACTRYKCYSQIPLRTSLGNPVCERYGIFRGSHNFP